MPDPTPGDTVVSSAVGLPMRLLVAISLLLQPRIAEEVIKSVEEPLGQATQDAASGEKAARELLEKMMAKFTTAKTIQFSVKMTVEENGKPAAELAGVVSYAPDGMERKDIEGKMKGKPFECRVICDGKKLWVKATGLGDPVVMDADSEDRMTRLDCLTRLGVYWDLFALAPFGEEKKDPDADWSFSDPRRLSDFKLGEKRKIGGRDAQSISYKMKVRRIKEPFQVTLWLDQEKTLPIERELTIINEGQSAKIREEYREIKLNEPIDEAKFKLPVSK